MPTPEQISDLPERRIEVPREVVEGVKDEAAFEQWFDQSFSQMIEGVAEAEKTPPEYAAAPEIASKDQQIDQALRAAEAELKQVAGEGLEKTDIGNMIARREAELRASKVGESYDLKRSLQALEGRIATEKTIKSPGWQLRVKRLEEQKAQLESRSKSVPSS